MRVDLHAFLCIFKLPESDFLLATTIDWNRLWNNIIIFDMGTTVAATPAIQALSSALLFAFLCTIDNAIWLRFFLFRPSENVLPLHCLQLLSAVGKAS
ncbi:hypothetical protein Ngar_c33560 [Candidatus Nitrososphaera gargensis Ga9.2]|uniref:Uncharacterized protein n=1 Tax=Nitrososphaera gargensis (strain Ga9.2) TaxID=1237085 RepID=K0IFV2_NITGG|nr:hypothetical protein Ngar_c33560 [Candidatus Nitrososphaera gargensis Ga9.2]